MARSLLEKHAKGLEPKIPLKEDLKVIPGGKQRRHNENTLSDADWYFIHSFWDSSLFNKHFMRDDFQRNRSARLAEYETEFQIFLNKFLNLCDAKRDEKFHTWNEDQIVQSWVMPVMECLGWWDKVQDSAIPELTFTIEDGNGKKTYRPDVAFLPSQRLKGPIQEKGPGERIALARRYVILTLEAKYWDRIRKTEKENNGIGTKEDLSKLKKSDSASTLSPGGQLLTYLKHLRNDDPVRNHFGIVTDGKVWRLHHVEHSEKQYFEFDLGDLFFEVRSKPAITDLTSKQYRCIEEAARYFYYIFSKSTLFSESGEPTLVDELLVHRRKYVKEAEPNLKDRFLNVMKIACNGFDRAFREMNVKISLEQTRDVAESYIFNLLFLKSCEAKGIIRYEANTNISITSIIERISYFDPSQGVDDQTNETINLSPKFKEFSYKNSETDLHKKILKLTELVQNGGSIDGGREISAFQETLFSNEEIALIKKCHLSNIETVKLLFELGYMEEDGKFRQVPYNIFTPEQLGSIYESFLEFTLSKTDVALEFLKKQWKPISKNTAEKLKKLENVRQPIAKKGELYFTPNNKERKASGTYYTPDHVVKFIVQETLNPICRNKSAKEILAIKICDPAMGSGHLLTEALRFVTDRYLEALGKEPENNYRMPSQAKRDILDACIFGVDINPRAVRLAKMALWLETAYSGKKLERLSDQLKCANSLTDESLWKNEWKFLSNGVDAVLGNPPYLGEKGHKDVFQNVAKSWLGKRFYVGKMDLLYFFFHLGLDILKEDGRLGYITTNYFTTALGARKLRSDFYERCNIETLVNLNELKVFEDAAGQHNMISVLTKTNTPKSTVLINSNEKGTCTLEILNEIVAGKNKKTVSSTVTRDNLYDGPEHYIRMSVSTAQSGKNQVKFDSIISKIKKSEFRLGKICEVNTGIMGGCDYVTKSNLSYTSRSDIESNDIQIKDGVFVLDTDNVRDRQHLTRLKGSRFLKPFFKNSDIQQFTSDIKPSKFIIFSSKDNNVLRDSSVAKHLQRFMKILTEIRSVNNESKDSWHILRRGASHEEIFQGPKIVAPQRSKVNTFGYNESPWFASADVYFITVGDNTQFDLKYLLGLLNSKLYFVWLYCMGKRKGENLELYQKPLSEIPIKDADVVFQSKVIKLTERLLLNPDDSNTISKLNSLVYEHYGLTKSEIESVETLFDSRISSKEERSSQDQTA